MKSKKNKIICLISIAAIALTAFFIYFNNTGEDTAFVSYAEFMVMAEDGQVSHVVLSDGAMIQFYTYASDVTYETSNPRNPALKEQLLLMGIEVSEGTGFAMSGLLSSVLPIAFFVMMFIFVIRMIARTSGKNAMSLNVTAADEISVDVGFNHVAGNDEAKESVQDVVDFIKNPEKYTTYGARMPRGIIFYGPPGTGKTLMARAIAGEAGVPFFATSGSDFVQMYVGVGASRVRELFKKARAAGRAVIFIDEIDAVGKSRASGNMGGNDERDQTLNALLAEMSGFSSGEGIVVIAATNRLDTLDEALLRPGRFDRQVEIGLPDLAGRKNILATHAKNKPLAHSIDMEELARQTVYFSGAMLENLLNEAAINAAKAGAAEIGPKEIDTAYYTIIAGSEKKDRSAIKEKERRITAYHEGGHALATKLLSPEHSVSKITIIPSTKGAAGFCVNLPPDKMYFTKRELENQVISLLAGRAAEEATFGADNVTTGASNDIERANRIIKDYVSKYGMSTSAGLAELSDEDRYKECQAHISKLYDEALALVKNNFHTLENIAQALLEKESLCERELDAIIASA
ncbi:MAG: ATP-dependent metallopeptidase FtsH/Yme1/Tma family protein [Defluviitaleaceae bacterium]|nr:ATP-dependent metallopeptidase FtsH/Yme1/Tma family protein [Defluviitaleaceae bacterium]